MVLPDRAQEPRSNQVSRRNPRARTKWAHSRVVEPRCCVWGGTAEGLRNWNAQFNRAAVCHAEPRTSSQLCRCTMLCVCVRTVSDTHTASHTYTPIVNWVECAVNWVSVSDHQCSVVCTWTAEPLSHCSHYYCAIWPFTMKCDLHSEFVELSSANVHGSCYIV